MAQSRNVTTVWTGDIGSGSGVLTAGTGAFSGLGISAATRFGEPNGSTSPEELVAGAHSGCYAMNLAATLTNNGTPPESINANSVVTVSPKAGGGFHLTSALLTVEAKVPGLTDEQFQALAKTAEETCPISSALRGNLEITLDATLLAE
ncbi:MAG TPA: OsmC family peroxiredoxin [Thermomicrobiales bacterium]|nr:OsmC family peroxiredoxin [Thermomicrobiales bacterium]